MEKSKDFVKETRRLDRPGSADSAEAWRKTARSRLRFELAGLAFALQKGSSPEDYARHLWSKGAAAWMKKEAPGAGEYLLKEARAFRTLYPDVSFTVAKEGETESELVFTRGCLGGWGKDPWVVAKSVGLAKTDVCRYCREAFRIWAGQMGLIADIGPENESSCRLRVRAPSNR